LVNVYNFAFGIEEMCELEFVEKRLAFLKKDGIINLALKRAQLNMGV